MKPIRLTLAQTTCRYLPPLLAQRARTLIYSRSSGYKDNFTYTVKSQTGSLFTSSTSDFHGYPFAVHGYCNWRAWAIARAVCTSGDTIIEIGANIGTETVGFADIVGCDGSVFAFEPLPSNVHSLTKTMKLLECNNVTILPFALSGKNERVRFKVPASKHMSGIGHILSTNVDQQHDNIIEVECRTLNSLEDRVGIATLVFMDTEGSEYSILKGGVNYFANYHPILVLEAGSKQLAHHGLRLQDLYNQLQSLNYEIFDIVRFGLERVSPDNFRSSASNWLCVHSSQQSDVIRQIKKYLYLCGWLPCLPGINPMSQRVR